MDRNKINEQARVLRAKKLAKASKPIAPQVQKGVVKIEVPLPKTSNNPKTYNAPKPPTHLAKKTTNAGQKVQQQTIKQQNVSTSKRQDGKRGCSGCRRKIRSG